MSLVFRSVKKISRKKRKGVTKSKSKKCFKDPFEDNPLKFIVEDEENYSEFPTLNSVYKTDLFGTPVSFKNGYGSDCMKYLKIKTKLQSIVFMNEYANKSFEELHWEDYQCNRKGANIFEDKNYLKCLSKENAPGKWKTILSPRKYELIEPVPTKILGKFPTLSKPTALEVNISNTENNIKQPQKTIILQRINEEQANLRLETVGRPYKERSILTSVTKNLQDKEARYSTEPDINRTEALTKSSSEINITARKEEMVTDNLKRYFSSAYTNASVPYEFLSQNNNYFLPCTNISLAYKNSRQTKLNRKNQNEYLQDLLKTNPFGYNSIFDKLEPVIETGSLYDRLFGPSTSIRIHKEFYEEYMEKYTPDNKFNEQYFWSKFNPYCINQRKGAPPNFYENEHNCSVRKCTKAKNYLLGMDIVS